MKYPRNILSLFEILTDIEDYDDIHLGRLLILLYIFAGRTGQGTINGLTKLAKLDFLLRYPIFLERALEKRTNDKINIYIQDYEKKSIESKMVRYLYGPWDYRYRKFINILVAKGLVFVEIKNHTIIIGLTPKGFEVASNLSNCDNYKNTKERASLLKRHLNLTSTNIKNFIYETFPEISTLKYGTEITYDI